MFSLERFSLIRICACPKTRTYHHDMHKKHGDESLETSSASESDLEG